MEQKKLNLNITTYRKINFRWFVYLTVKDNTIQLPYDYIGHSLFEPGWKKELFKKRMQKY